MSESEKQAYAIFQMDLEEMDRIALGFRPEYSEEELFNMESTY